MSAYHTKRANNAKKRADANRKLRDQQKKGTAAYDYYAVQTVIENNNEDRWRELGKRKK